MIALMSLFVNTSLVFLPLKRVFVGVAHTISMIPELKINHSTDHYHGMFSFVLAPFDLV